MQGCQNAPQTVYIEINERTYHEEGEDEGCGS